jgi:uncharacterized protein
LLDINVLIALLDPAHVHHDPAHAWFAGAGRSAWATCPLTENGVLRIVGHPRYPSSPGSPAAVAPLLTAMCSLPGHAFWPDEVSLLRSVAVNTARLLTSAQVTDTYLLALAQARGGRLATFDRRIVADAVEGGRSNVELIG